MGTAATATSAATTTLRVAVIEADGQRQCCNDRSANDCLFHNR
jgi:hypothetical protein